MSQLSLEFSPARLARSHDPRTSKAAAENVASFKASHEAHIFSAIVDAGPAGENYRGIARRTGMEPVAVARRLSAMGKRGLIERSAKSDCSGFEQRNGMCIWRAIP